MTPIHVYTTVLISVSFQQKMSASKIVFHQTLAENHELENLKVFARGGDPCGKLPSHHIPGVPSRANDECVLAATGYAKLPPKAKKRCDNAVKERTGCMLDPSRPGSWYCGLVLSKNKKVVKLSDCIQNLNLGCSNEWLQRSLRQPSRFEGTRNRGKTVAFMRPPSEDRETYFKHLQMLMGAASMPFPESGDSQTTEVAALDPCAGLEQTPDADAILTADRMCKAAIDDFKKLPIEAKDRCQNTAMQNEGCKREPHPSKKWCCGLDLQVKRTGLTGCFLPKKTGTVCFKYCMQDLEIRILT